MITLMPLTLLAALLLGFPLEAGVTWAINRVHNGITWMYQQNDKMEQDPTYLPWSKR